MTVHFLPVNIPGVKLNDRRVAASDEYRTRNNRAIYLGDYQRERRRLRSLQPNSSGRIQVRLPRNHIPGYDVRRRRLLSRNLNAVNRVILHQTGPMDVNAVDTPGIGFREDDHRLDVVIAHFVVRTTGEVLYTHDAQLILNGTSSLRDCVEIEFHGSFNSAGYRQSRTQVEVDQQSDRVGADQLRAGRNLVSWLRSSASGMNIQSIHPHQQYSPSTRPNCPGPDIWVNIGEWAKSELKLHSNTGRRDRTISERTSNPHFTQSL